MDTFWLVFGIILMLVGILGSILPLLPGPPLCYIALLLQQLRSDTPFTAIGLIAGFWLGPFGIIIGPFVGAFVGELIASNNSEHALKAAWGSFVGFLFGTLLKLVVCLVMAWYLFTLVF